MAGLKFRDILGCVQPCLNDYDWESLGPATVIEYESCYHLNVWKDLKRPMFCSVAGGGCFSLPLLSKFDHLALVIQDLPDVVLEAKKVSPSF